MVVRRYAFWCKPYADAIWCTQKNIKIGRHYTVFKIAIFARNRVGQNSQMIALKMAISSNMQGAKSKYSSHL